MGRPKRQGLKPYRTAAQCINWSLPCPSIFLTRDEAREVGCKRPLAEATLRRIANGVWRYVINAKQPFIVRTGHWSNITGKGKGFRGQSTRKPLSTIHCTNDYGMVVPSLVGVGGRAGQSRPRGVNEPAATATTKADTAVVAPLIAPVTHQGDRRCNSPNEPMPTITGAHRGEQAVIGATLVGAGGPAYSGKPTRVDRPMGSQTTENHRAVAEAFLLRFRGTPPAGAVPVDNPMPTITAGSHQSRPAGAGHALGVVAAHLTHLRGTNRNGHAANEPAPTITGGGTHLAEVRAFLCAYFGNDKDGQSVRDPMRTVTAKERFGLVTVEGHDYQIVDIGMRMLTPRELARAQGFPEGYYIDVGPGGRTLTKTEQVKLIGNSVAPQVAQALVKANYIEQVAMEESA